MQSVGALEHLLLSLFFLVFRRDLRFFRFAIFSVGLFGLFSRSHRFHNLEIVRSFLFLSPSLHVCTMSWPSLAASAAAAAYEKDAEELLIACHYVCWIPSIELQFTIVSTNTMDNGTTIGQEIQLR